MWAETTGRLEELKGILDEECNRYNCNKQRISVAGHSRGAIGTWGIVSKYPGYFYAAIPVSCGNTRGFSAKNCTKTKIRAYGGNVGPYEPSYSSRMQSIVRQIKGYGGDATFTLLSGAGHGDTPGKAFTQENMLWMVN